ncbi:MAG: InlB B-repeat-containing protein [Clostridia bacterium]|nr:InlB B-repeat-containing protein [Clostridia bacterium]
MKKKTFLFGLIAFVFGVVSFLPSIKVSQDKVAYAQSVDASVWDGTYATSVTNKDFYGDIASDSNFYIRSAKGLSYFAQMTNRANGAASFSGKNVYLETDINLNGYDWSPIAMNSVSFNGNFYGQGHCIYNLSISSNKSKDNGFFGKVSGGRVVDLHIRGCDINYTASSGTIHSTGVLAGNVKNASIEDCSVEGKISLSGSGSGVDAVGIGGVVGTADNTTLRRLLSNVEIDFSNGYDNFVGGIAGASYGGTSFEECAVIANEMNVTSTVSRIHLGGLVGASNGGAIRNCYSIANLVAEADTAFVGGLIGESAFTMIEGASTTRATTITTSYNAGNISFGDEEVLYAGGLVGYVNGARTTFADVYALGSVEGATSAVQEYESSYIYKSHLYNLAPSGSVQGKVFYDRGASLYTESPTSTYESVYKFRTMAQSRGLYAHNKYISAFGVWDFDNVWAISASLNGSFPYLKNAFNNANADNGVDYSYSDSLEGSGTVDNPYLIRTAGDLGWLSFNYSSSMAGKYYSLQNDIDLTGRTWKPIGDSEANPFEGVFDGNGFTIGGITCSLLEKFNYHGLFGITKNAVIKNLVVGQMYLINSATAYNRTGALVGTVGENTYIINCRDEDDQISAIGGMVNSAKPLYVFYGKLNANANGGVENSTVVDFETGKVSNVVYGYDITLNTNGGAVYDDGGDIYKGEYHLLMLQSTKSITLPQTSSSRVIDTSFAKNESIGVSSDITISWLPKTSDYYGETDVIIKRGSRLLCYRYNNAVQDLVGETIDFSKDILKGINAVYIEGSGSLDDYIQIKVIYNEYEFDKFETEYQAYSGNSLWQLDGANRVYVTYYYEYDSFIGENPDIFRTPRYLDGEMIYLRDGNFEVAGIYYEYSNGVFSKPISAGEFANKNKVLYADWDDTEKQYSYKIKLQKTEEQFAKDFKFEDAIESVSLKYYRENVLQKTIVRNYENLTISQDDSVAYAEFEFDTSFSVKAGDYLQVDYVLKTGYCFSETESVEFVCLENEADFNFGSYIFDATMIEEDKADRKALSKNKFVHLVGDFELRIRLAREFNSVPTTVGPGIYFGLAPMLDDFDDVYVMRNGIEPMSLSALNGDFILRQTAVDEAKSNKIYVGYDFYNNAMISSSIVQDKMNATVELNTSEYLVNGNQVRVVYHYNSKSDLYFVYEQDVDTYVVTLYQTDSSWNKIAHLVAYDTMGTLSSGQARVYAYTNSTFATIFATQDVSQLKFKNVKPVSSSLNGEFEYFNLSGNNPDANGITPDTKGIMKFIALTNFDSLPTTGTENPEIFIQSEYTTIVFALKLVDKDGNDIYGIPVKKLPKLSFVNGNTYDIDTTLTTGFSFEIKASDYYKFKYDTKLVWAPKADFNIRIKVNHIESNDPNVVEDLTNNIESGSFFTSTSVITPAQNEALTVGVKRDTYTITLAENDLKKMLPGYYTISLCCTDIFYNIDYSTKFVQYGKIDEFVSSANKNKFVEENSKVTATVTVNGAGYVSKSSTIKFEDEIVINTQLGDNYGYEFYDWYVEGYNYSGFTTDVFRDAGQRQQFDFIDRYTVTGQSEENERYRITLYAVYQRKSLSIQMDSSIYVLDWNGEIGTNILYTASSLLVGDNVTLAGKDNKIAVEGRVDFDYSTLTETDSLLDDLKMIKSAKGNSASFYLAGYRLFDGEGRQVEVEGALVEVLSASKFTDNIDLYDVMKTLLETNAEIGVLSAYYLQPVFRQKFANIYLHSGTGIGNVYGDGLNGQVFDKDGTETTNAVVKLSSQFSLNSIYLNDTFSGLIDGTAKIFNPEEVYATRKGYELPYNDFWTNGEKTLNGSNLYLDYNFFETESQESEETSVDLHLYRLWTPNTYTITFNANGGEFLGQYIKDTFSISIVYDSVLGESPAPNITVGASGEEYVVPDSSRLMRIGYGLASWQYDLVDVFDKRGVRKVSNALFDANGRFVFAGDVEVFATWEEITDYVLHIYLNNAEKINGETILEADRKGKVLTYYMTYGFNFNQLRDEEDNDVRIDDLTPTRKGFEFVGFYAFNETNEQKIVGETIFNLDVLTCNISATPVLKLYAKWTYISDSVELDLNSTDFGEQTYNATAHTLYLATKFASENIASKNGINITANETDMSLALSEIETAKFEWLLSSSDATIADGKGFSFEVRNAGTYQVVLGLSLTDEATYFNLGQLWAKTFTFNLKINKAQLTAFVDDIARLSNLQRIMKPYIKKEVQDKVSAAPAISDAVEIIKESENLSNALSNLEVYNFIMTKYYLLSHTNVGEEHLTYKKWTYSDFTTYVSENEEEYEEIIEKTTLFTYYDVTKDEAKIDLSSFYKVSANVNSPTVDNALIATEASAHSVKIVDLAKYFMPLKSYETRIYLTSSTNALGNYEYLVDEEEKPYLLLPQQTYMFPQIIEVENGAESMSAYFNSNVQEVKWYEDSTSIELFGKTFYLQDCEKNDQLFAINAKLYTSNAGNNTNSTNFNFVDNENGLYFDEVEVALKQKVGEGYQYSLLTEQFKLVLAEDEVYTILSIDGVAALKVYANYFTKKPGGFENELVSSDLASDLLNIVSISYENEGVSGTIRQSDTAPDGSKLIKNGVVSIDGLLIGEIKNNGTNALEFLMSAAVKEIEIATSMQVIGDDGFVRLYQWSDVEIYSIDEQADVVDSNLIIKKEDIDFNEETLTTASYYATYTDLVLVQYDYNIDKKLYKPESVETSLLKLGSSTQNDIIYPSVKGFVLSDLRAVTKFGIKDIADIFEGEDLGSGQVYTGISEVGDIFATVVLRAYWEVEDIKLVRIVGPEALKYSVHTFTGLSVGEIVSFLNKNTDIYTYAYTWLKKAEDGSYKKVKFESSETLTLASRGEASDDGDYRLEIEATVKSEFVDSLVDKTKKSSTASVDFSLKFMRYLISEVEAPTTGESTEREYNGRDQIDSWSMKITYYIYDNEKIDYSNAASVQQLYYVTTGSIFYKVYFNGTETTTMKDAGTYRIVLCVDDDVYEFAETVQDSDKEFVMTISPTTIELNTYEFALEKVFNSPDPELKSYVTCASQNFAVRFSREAGEAVGEYALYFADVVADVKENFIFTHNGVVLYENGVLTEAGNSTRVGTFTITAGGRLILSYDTAKNPAITEVDFEEAGYTLNLTEDFKLQIKNGAVVVKEFELQLYDDLQDEYVEFAAVDTQLKNALTELTVSWYSSELLSNARNCGTYSYAFQASVALKEYYSAVEMKEGFEFRIKPITIDVDELNLDKDYDGKTIGYFMQDGTQLESLAGYSGVYVKAEYTSAHAGTNVPVRLSVGYEGEGGVLTNYVLSSTSKSAKISKLKATMTLSLTKNSYVYGEVSVNKLADLIKPFVIEDESGKDVSDLLVSGYYTLTYKLDETVQTNANGFVYKGEDYQIEASATFQDFDMTLVLPTFDVTALTYEKTIEEGHIRISIFDQVKATYNENLSIATTGDEVVLKFVPVGIEAGQYGSANTFYDLSLQETFFANNSIIVSLATENNGLFVAASEGSVYVKVDNLDILTQTYNGDNYTISANKDTIRVETDGGFLEQSSLSYYLKDDEGNLTELSQEFEMESIAFVSGVATTTFKNSGSYRLSVVATSSSFVSVLLLDELEFVINKRQIDIDQFTIEKPYDGSSSYVINDFNEKVAANNVSIVAQFASVDVGTNVPVTLYLQGENRDNYELSSKETVGTIGGVSASIEVLKTNYVYGEFGVADAVQFKVKDANGTVAPIEYDIQLSLEGATFSGAGYLEVGTYNVKLDSAISENYTISLAPVQITVAPFEWNLELTQKGGYKVEVGSLEASQVTFKQTFLSPLFESVAIDFVREAGAEVGCYRVISGSTEDDNYLLTVSDESEGYFEVTKFSQILYVLASAETEVKENGGDSISMVYDGVTYDTLTVELVEGQYKLVISNATISTLRQEFDLNFYRYDNQTTYYYKVNVEVTNFTSTLKFLSISARDVGSYQIYANSTTSNEFEVRMGRRNSLFAYTLNITKRPIYFDSSKLLQDQADENKFYVTKTFDNKDAVFNYQNASEILTNIAESDTLKLDVSLQDGAGNIVKYCGIAYTVVAQISGESKENYDLQIATETGKDVLGYIARADLVLEVDTQRFVYGTYQDSLLRYAYSTSVDLSTYDFANREFEISLRANYALNGSDFSPSGHLKVGEYDMYLTFSSDDFDIATYIVDGGASATLTAKVFVDAKTLTLQEKEIPLDDVFTKIYDGTNRIDILNADSTKKFDIEGVEAGDAVEISQANYTSEYVGHSIKVDFLLSGVDSSNYVVESWLYGVINPIVINLEFVHNAGGATTTTNVVANGLVELSQLSYPFMSTAYLTANSLSAQTSSTKNFPSAVTGYSGYTFLYWTMEFEGIAEGSAKYTFLTSAIAKYGITYTYEADKFSLRVGNDKTTVQLLNSLVGEDTGNLFGYHYKSGNPITFTFKANWDANIYTISVDITDKDGVSSTYGKIVLDNDDGDDSNNIELSKKGSINIGHSSPVVVKATANDHYHFLGFYLADGTLLYGDGREPGITVTQANGEYVLKIESVTQNYDIDARFDIQAVNIKFDLKGTNAAINSTDFIRDVFENVYEWKTNYDLLDGKNLSNLATIERLGFEVVSIAVSGDDAVNQTVLAEDFETTDISDLVDSATEKEITITLTPNFDAVGVGVILNYGYDSKIAELVVPFNSSYDSAEGWEENPIRTGYTFGGWYNETGAKVTGSDILTSAETQILTAIWTKNSYKLSLIVKNADIVDCSYMFVLTDIEGGKHYSADAVEFETEISFTVVAYEGYEISAAWNENFAVVINEDKTADITFTMPAQDLEYSLPILVKGNVVTVEGENISVVQAFEVDGEDEDELTVVEGSFEVRTEKKLKLKITPSVGYSILEEFEISNKSELTIKTSYEDNVLVVVIEGIKKETHIVFASKENKNNITLSFSDASLVEFIEVGGLIYSNVGTLAPFEVQTNSTMEAYIKFVHGFMLSDATSAEYTVEKEHITDGTYAGYYKVTISGILTDGDVLISIEHAKYTLTMIALSYDEDKNLVDISANKAFANGKEETTENFDTVVKLTYINDQLYSFAGWSKDGLTIFSTDKTIDYQITKNETVYAIFSKFKFNINLKTYNYYTLNNEYGEPSLIKPVYQLLTTGRYFDGTKEINSLELYFGSNKEIKFKVPNGYVYRGLGYNDNGTFIYLNTEEKIGQEVFITISTLDLNMDNANVDIFVVVRALKASLSFQTEIDIDGVREPDLDVGYIELVGQTQNKVNEYGYLAGTRVHYSSDSFVSGKLLSNKKFTIEAYTGEVFFIKVMLEREGYKFLRFECDNAKVMFTQIIYKDGYYIYEVSHFSGADEPMTVKALFRPHLNSISVAFEDEGTIVEGGAFKYATDNINSHKVWSSGTEYSQILVSAYTDSTFEVVAYIGIGYTIDPGNLQIVDDSKLIIENSLSFESLSVVETGYCGRLRFRLEGYLGSHSIRIAVKPRTYTVHLQDGQNILATIKNVRYGELLDLSRYNYERGNIEVFDERIVLSGDKLAVDIEKELHNFEGYFTYENGAGVRYINSEGISLSGWRESGYVLNPFTSKYEKHENAQINEQTGEVSVSLFIYWSYLKTRISFEFVPGISTNYTAQDMVQGVDFSNSWFYATSPHYIEVSFNTYIHIVAPEIGGYKFYKFVISQKNSEGIWLSDVIAYSSDIPWSTNEYDRIVECKVQIVYFAKVDVSVFGGEGGYVIEQLNSDTQAKILLKEFYVDTSKSFTITAKAAEGYEFFRWINNANGQTSYNASYTTQTDVRISLVLTLQGLKVTLDFTDYETKFGQILNMQAKSQDNSIVDFRLGAFSGTTFIKLLPTINKDNPPAGKRAIRVGDVLTFAVSIEYGFGATWKNRRDVEYKEYSGELYYFTLTVKPSDAGKVVKIWPIFTADALSIYIARDFAKDQISEIAVDQNSVDLAGYTTYNGAITDFVSSDYKVNVTIPIVVSARYEVSQVIVRNYEKYFQGKDNFLTEANEIFLSKEFLAENDIVGTVQVEIKFKRKLWEENKFASYALVGKGTAKDPYLIETAEDLAFMMKKINSGARDNFGNLYSEAYYLLMTDLQLTEQFWTPIGTEASKFNGTFNFNNYEISGIYNAFFYDTISFKGLFGIVGAQGKIILSITSLWYLYLIGGLVGILVIAFTTIVLIAVRRKRRRSALSVK